MAMESLEVACALVAWPSVVSVAASEAPWIKRSKFARMSCAYMPCGMSPAKVMRLSVFVHGQDGTDQIFPLRKRTSYREREEQARCGKAGRSFPEILFVQVQGRSPIQFIQHMPV